MKFLPHLPSYGRTLHPSRDWNVLVTLALTCFVISAIWNVWLYGQVANGAIFGVHSSTTVQPLNQAALEALTNVFANRATLEESYKNGTHQFVDPSK